MSARSAALRAFAAPLGGVLPLGNHPSLEDV